MAKTTYEVFAENIGSVYHGNSKFKAEEVFKDYKELCKKQAGRIGKSVTLFRNSETTREYRQGDPDEE